jgi:hypothetical protein
MAIKPPSTTSSWVTSMAMKIITIWCLQKFPHTAHPHGQLAYSINRHLILYTTLARCWFLTIQESLLSKMIGLHWQGGSMPPYPHSFSQYGPPPWFL